MDLIVDHRVDNRYLTSGHSSRKRAESRWTHFEGEFGQKTNYTMRTNSSAGQNKFFKQINADRFSIIMSRKIFRQKAFPVRLWRAFMKRQIHSHHKQIWRLLIRFFRTPGLPVANDASNCWSAENQKFLGRSFRVANNISTVESPPSELATAIIINILSHSK